MTFIFLYSVGKHLLVATKPPEPTVPPALLHWILAMHIIMAVFITLQFCIVPTKDWGLENNTNLNSFFLFNKKFRNCVYFFLPAFNLIIWLMASPKNFEK